MNTLIKRYNDDNFMTESKSNPLYDFGQRLIGSKDLLEAYNKLHSFIFNEMAYDRWHNLNSILLDSKYPKWQEKLIYLIKCYIVNEHDLCNGYSITFSNDYKKFIKQKSDLNYETFKNNRKHGK